MPSAITHDIMGRRNRAGALELIRRSGGMSRMDLAKRLGLSRAALTNIASELVKADIVRDDMTADLSRDMPRSFLRLNPEWGCAVAINLTHNLAIGVVDLAGNLVTHRRLAGDDAAHDAYRDKFESLLLPAVSETLASLDGKRVLGIGVLSYGRVDREGVIRENASLPRADMDMQRVLATVTDVPVRTDQEFRLLLLSSVWRDDPARFRNAVAMSGKLSGCGGAQAILMEGALCYGAGGFSGQYGWADLTPHHDEDISGLDERVARNGGAAAFLAAVCSGEPRASALYRKAVENYGFRVAHVVNSLNPEQILLYTAYALMGGRFLADVCAETAKLAIPTNMEGLDLRFGGARTDEEHLAAAAMPLLMEFFTDGGLDVPLLRRMRWKG